MISLNTASAVEFEFLKLFELPNAEDIVSIPLPQ